MVIMKGLLIILLVLGISPVKAQVSLNLEKCREMALESSKKMSIATKQGEKAEFERKAYRANFLPKLSATGLYAYIQKKSSYTIDGGYLPTFVLDDNRELVYNLYVDPTTKLPVMGKDGLPLAKAYAFMPDIESGQYLLFKSIVDINNSKIKLSAFIQDFTTQIRDRHIVE